MRPAKRFEFSRARATVRVDGHSAELTPLEVRLLDYLLARRGELVPREALERDVWGFGEAVDSEAVPVGMRRLRAKLGPHADQILRTERSRGWILTVPRAPVGPRDVDPYVARPAAQDRLGALVARGWRIVTVAGAPGMGKTRLVAHFVRAWTGDVIWVSLGDLPRGTGVEAVRGLLCRATGSEVATPAELRWSLATRSDTLVVLDEAEGVLDPVRELVEELQDVRFLLTSREDLGRTDEAVVELGPMAPDEARQLLETRLAASRWGTPADEATLRQAVSLLDGHPLALELVAAHPDPLADIVRELERGEVPPGPEFTRLRQVIARSVEPLDDESLALLRALAVCATPLTEAEIRDWLGPRAGVTLRDLSWRSLVVRESNAWTVPRATGLFVSETIDAEPIRRDLAAWLVRRAEALRARMVSAPREADAAVRRLATALIDLAGRLPLESTVRLLRALVELFGTLGPASARLEAAERALGRYPNDLHLRLLVARARKQLAFPTDLEQGAEHPDLDVRIAAALARRFVQPWTSDVVRLRVLAEASEDRILALRLRSEHAMVLLETDPEAAAAAARSILADATHEPVLALPARSTIAWALLRQGDPQGALRELEAAVSDAEGLEVEPIALALRQSHAFAVADRDAAAAVAPLEALSRAWTRLGDLARCGEARGMRGLLAFALDDPDTARMELAFGAEHDRGHVGRSCVWVSKLLAVREGREPVSALIELRASIREGVDREWFDRADLWVALDVEEALATGPVTPDARAAFQSRLDHLRHSGGAFAAGVATALSGRLGTG